MEKVLITGGAGFIGQAAVRAAHQELERRGIDPAGRVIVFDRPYNVVEGLHAPELKGVDCVIHLAGVLGTAELFAEVRRAVDVNILGTINVLNFCAERGAHYVGITMPDVFPSIYTATKVCADRLASAWHNAHEVRVSRVRAFNAYGPGQKHGPGHPQKIIPTFATEAWAGRPIPIWGDGNQTVDLVHVDDLGRLLVAATRFGDDEVFDGGTGMPLTVNAVAQFVLEVTGSKAGIAYLPMRKGEVPTKIAAAGDGWDKLAKGERPVVSMERLQETIEWYRPA